ncbi:MAG: FG-GAP-like repeat-containing protein [Planctomycetota bacterium]
MAILLAAVPLCGQSTAHRFTGNSAQDWFGVSVRGAGDVDGDSLADIIVGAPADSTNGTWSGAAFVYSGASGALLYSFFGTTSYESFGSAVDTAGDVNGDGYDDLLIGVPGKTQGGLSFGGAYVYSGADGTQLYAFDGVAQNGRFGAQVAGVGDANGDGFDDVAVSASAESGVVIASGIVRIYSGRDGAVLQLLQGNAFLGDFGYSIAGIGDLDGDGSTEVLVGARNETGAAPYSGMVYAFSGQTGLPILSISGNAYEDLGGAVSGAGDVDGDGVSDLIASGFGVSRVYSGATGAVMWSLLSGNFYRSVGGAGDVDGDGYADLLVGFNSSAPFGVPVGQAYLYSGRTGALMQTFLGTGSGDRYGHCVSGVGDITGDGLADFAVGALGQANDPGRVEVFTFAPLVPRVELVTFTAQDSDALCNAGDIDGDGVDDVFVADDTLAVARLHSGADGSVLWTAPGYGFSMPVSAAGDTNNDGINDVILGDPTVSRAYVLSGVDGSVLHTLVDPVVLYSSYGESVAGLGDVNGDGHADVAVGHGNAGRVDVYSGASGAILWTQLASNHGTGIYAFAFCIASAGDLDGDGIGDLLVDTSDDDTFAFSGSSGALIHRLVKPVTSTFLGRQSVRSAGDVNGDGRPDVVVAAGDISSAFVFSGLDGSLLQSFTMPQIGFGWAVDGAGDQDGDGQSDVLLSSPFGTSRVYVMSPLTGQVIDIRDAAPGTNFGFSMACADVNDDGATDILLSTNYNLGGAFVQAWQSSFGGDAGRAVPYGRACGDGSRIARIASSDRANVGQPMELRLGGAAVNSITSLFLGDPQSSAGAIDPLGLPLGIIGLPDCSLHTTAIASVGAVTDAVGRASVSIPVPNNPALAATGLRFMFQWVTLDLGVAANLPLSFSDGLLVDFGL